MRGLKTAQDPVSELHTPGRGNPRRAGRGTGARLPRSPGELRKHLPAPAASFLGARVRKTLRKNTPMSLTGLRPTGFCFPPTAPAARGSLRAAAAVGPRGSPRRAGVPSPLARPPARPPPGAAGPPARRSVRPPARQPLTSVRVLRQVLLEQREVCAGGEKKGRVSVLGRRRAPAARRPLGGVSPRRPVPGAAKRGEPPPPSPPPPGELGPRTRHLVLAPASSSPGIPLREPREPGAGGRARAGGGARGAGRGPGLRRRRLPSARPPPAPQPPFARLPRPVGRRGPEAGAFPPAARGALAPSVRSAARAARRGGPAAGARARRAGSPRPAALLGHRASPTAGRRPLRRAPLVARAPPRPARASPAVRGPGSRLRVEEAPPPPARSLARAPGPRE